MKAIFEELNHEAWLVLVALECGDIVAYSEGKLHVRIKDTLTHLEWITKQELKEETLDQLEKYNLIEHIPGEHLDTIGLTESGRYWLKRKGKVDTSDFKREMKHNPLAFLTGSVQRPHVYIELLPDQQN